MRGSCNMTFLISQPIGKPNVSPNQRIRQRRLFGRKLQAYFLSRLYPAGACQDDRNKYQKELESFHCN